MASKSSQSTESQSPNNPTPTPSSQTQPRPQRVKHIPKKLASGVDEGIPGVPSLQESRPKKLTIKEPSPTQKKTPIDPAAAKRKDKGPAIEAPKQKKKKSTSTAPQGPSTQMPPPNIAPRIGINNFITCPWFCINNPILFPPVDLEKFRNDYASRKFCPIIYVNLHSLKSECNLDLFPWLGPYQNLLSIRAPFSPHAVRTFYFNLSVHNLLDKDGNVEEERLFTQLRGKRIMITVDSLNSLLGITDPPSPPFVHYSNEEIHEILRPHEPLTEPVGKLSFNPIDMPPIYRALWYIYSRNMIQKSKNFTHFSLKDYRLFASIVAKVPHNLGHWIFEEMKNYIAHSKPSSTIPFPNLVSLILFSNHIWYLERDEKPIIVKPFDQHHLNLMKITFKEDSGQSKAPSQSKASQSLHQEVQSAPPTQSVPPPPPQNLDFSSLESKIQAMIDQAVSTLTAKFESSISSLVQTTELLERKVDNLYDCLEEQVETLNGLKPQPGQMPASSTPIDDDKGGEETVVEPTVEPEVPVETEVAKEPPATDPIAQEPEIVIEQVLQELAVQETSHEEAAQPQDPSAAAQP